MKNRLLILFAFALLCAGNAGAQNITAATYTFSRSGFSPATLTDPITLIGANADDVASAVTDIGFTFWFAGTPYTQFSVSENGLLTLGDVQISGTDNVNDLTSGTTIPKIAPYWDDLSTGTNGSVVYTVTGTAPNRILYINWNVTVPKNIGNAANSLFQVQLSETSGNITFTYGTPAMPANANQYTIGIGASTTDFASVTVTSATAATVNYVTANNSNTLSIGAYSRFNFFTDRTAPSITGTVIPNTGGIANRTCTRTITDAKTGVPLSGNFIPRIYFKKSTQTEWFSTPGAFQSGTAASSVWLFTIDHDLLGGVTAGDYVQYYVVAQDNANTVGVPNISSLPAGVMATDVNTIITPPSTPSQYIIGASFSGTKTVGEGGDYTSFTNAGGLFEQLNAGSVEGNLTINVISDITSESGLVALNEFASPYTITVNPAGNRTISAPSGDLIRLNGTDRFTIDGLNDGTNSLTIIAVYGSAVKLYNGAQYNTFTNLTLKGAGSYGVVTMSTNGSFSDAFNTISNNVITSSGTNKPGTGVYFYEYSTGNTGNVIHNNVISDFGQYGIQAYRTTNTTITNNDIYQFNGTGWGIGIKFDANGYSHGTVNIANNKIHDLNTGGLNNLTAAIYYMSGNVADLFNIYNNVISVQTSATNPTADKIYGMLLGGQGTSNVSFNTVYIGGTNVTSGNSTCLHKSANGTIHLNNNNFFNARSNTAFSIYYNHFAITTANLTNFNSDYNNFFVTGTSSYLGNVGIDLGMSQGIDYATLTDWQTATGKDANSISADPMFTSSANLFPQNYALNAGTPVTGITTDITGITRDAVAPTIGAYEISHLTIAVNLNLFIEGLYTGAGAMSQAYDAAGPHWPAGVADHITVELHDAANYATIVYSEDVALSTSGSATFDVTPNYNGTYFVTVKHRNSIETTTPSALSFSGSIVSHDFTSSASQAFGNNLKQSVSVFLIYSGDVNQDGAIDTGDMLPVDNDSFNYSSGYLSADVNGDGLIDTGDMLFIDNNSALYIGAILP